MSDLDMESINEFLRKVSVWASTRDDVIAITLVGSYARGDTHPDSDIDLVIILEDRQKLMHDDKWPQLFGAISNLSWEDWGKVQSLRVHYVNSMEIEFGLADETWLASPIDEGTRAVLMRGVVVIYDLDQYASRQFQANGIPYSVVGYEDA
jgi:predicted nucleotidyltransferase